MTSDNSTEWYEHRFERDKASMERSEAHLGLEKAIFAEAMSLLVRLIDAMLTAEDIDDQIQNINLKHRIAVANYGFNLLSSAWNDALSGRYHAATDHFRSIDECPDFLMALFLDPRLSDDWTDVQGPSIALIRRRISDGIGENRRNSAELMERMQDVAKPIQPLAHVSVQSIGQYLPLVEREGKRWRVVRLGGAVSHVTLRLVAIQIATSAVHLLGAAFWAFDDILKVDLDLLRRYAEAVIARSRALTEQLQALSSEATDPVAHGIYFASSDELL